MSTKDLSRSAVEGGRSNSNKYERNQSHRHERSRAKVWLDHLRFDPDVAEDSAPQPRNPVYKGFTDKLNPCWGWLASHVGQPWDDVYSKLARTFDTRKLSAWHIVNQHMLAEVEGAGTTSDALAHYRSQRFVIDEDGILRDRGKNYRKSTRLDSPTQESALAYARGRKVFDFASEQWWALPDENSRWVACPHRTYFACRSPEVPHRLTETTPVQLVEKYNTPGLRSLGANGWWRTYVKEHLVPRTWRKHKKFTKADASWWQTLNYDTRSALKENAE